MVLEHPWGHGWSLQLVVFLLLDHGNEHVIFARADSCEDSNADLRAVMSAGPPGVDPHSNCGAAIRWNGGIGCSHSPAEFCVASSTSETCTNCTAACEGVTERNRSIDNICCKSCSSRCLDDNEIVSSSMPKGTLDNRGTPCTAVSRWNGGQGCMLNLRTFCIRSAPNTVCSESPSTKSCEDVCDPVPRYRVKDICCSSCDPGGQCFDADAELFSLLPERAKVRSSCTTASQWESGRGCGLSLFELCIQSMPASLCPGEDCATHCARAHKTARTSLQEICCASCAAPRAQGSGNDQSMEFPATSSTSAPRQQVTPVTVSGTVSRYISSFAVALFAWFLPRAWLL